MSLRAKMGDGGEVELAGPVRCRVSGKISDHGALSKSFAEQELTPDAVRRLVQDGYAVRLAFGPHWRVIQSVEDEANG